MLLEDITIGIQGTTHCQWCDHEFCEGDIATVLVSQPAGTDRWVVHRTYCAACDPSAVADPTLSCAELLFQCRLGTQAEPTTQQTELVALDPELVDATESAEGQSILETDDEDAETGPTPTSDDFASVEIETLPPSLSVPASHHHPVTGTSYDTVRFEEQPILDGDAE